MAQKLKLIKNAANRKVPTMVNGLKSIPFKGIGKYSPKGLKASPPIKSCQDYPSSGNKVVASLKEALINLDVLGGMTRERYLNGEISVSKLLD